MSKRHLPTTTTALVSLGAKAWLSIASALCTLIIGRANTYRPEAHYMRGPGPKWRAKHAPASARQ
jgi:hypothetical protein